MSALVRVDAVSKAYRSGGTETRVLRAASLTLVRGETTSLVGASGSGKSTLIALIAGLMRPEAGTISFDGQALTDLDEMGLARLRARRIGVVLQKDNLIGFLTAAENVELAIEFGGGDRRAERARALLARVGLADRADQLPRRLSGGEAQRVAIAVALANDPDLLLADEVTGQLDSDTAGDVMRRIFDACRERGLTVLFVTHNRELAGGAHHRLQLVDGEVRAA
ncbi:ABC transporter ATP-binding protein [Solirubrobacter ginsenosidimutans]|uniref:ABC transporter ATP-binding protein n=1 Tax=Solirubrobacter ginsenosidimutans TaxID=490573 RepID=A0A9X3MQ93_9ACTN|nr:ABC transporter ATP-binding protein [Solirubrobacter ginsenosidimutans]MDA0160449.1 ABC transporter ATP-binding protein [Solirubrobacter ginsenosidimutans]